MLEIINSVLTLVLLLLMLGLAISMIVERISETRYKKQFHKNVLNELSEAIKDLEREEK